MKTQPVTHPSQRTGRAAMVVAALAVSGVGLTAFVVGVNGGSEAEKPPAPDVPPTVEMKVPEGVDQRLYELADEYEAEQRKAGPGPDRRLYELARKHAMEETVPGPDQRLYELAEQYADRMSARR